jgi:hypothetical protein
VLSERGAPTPVARTRLRAPRSLMAQVDPAAQEEAVANSTLYPKYATPVDRESAYEKLAARLAPPEAASPAPPASSAAQAAPGISAAQAAPAPRREVPDSSDRSAVGGGGAMDAVAGALGSPAFKSFARSAASVLGREITRSLFGTAKRRR